MKLERADIITLLAANASVTTLVSTRIWACLAPKDSAFPYITVSIAATDRPRTMDQRATPTRKKADKRTWVVTAYSKDVDEASDLAEAIDEALDTKTSSNIQRMIFDGLEDHAEFRSDDSDEIIFAIPVQFIAFRKPVD